MRIELFVGLVMWGGLAMGCKSNDPGGKPSREACTKAGEHIAELVIAHNVDHAEDWWDAMHAEGGETGLPGGVSRDTFKAYLESPEGKTWLLQRRGNTHTGTQQVVEACVANATAAQVNCLIAAKSKADVAGCDQKHARKPSPSGESTGSAAAGSDGATVPSAAGSSAAESK